MLRKPQEFSFLILYFVCGVHTIIGFPEIYYASGLQVQPDKIETNDTLPTHPDTTIFAITQMSSHSVGRVIRAYLEITFVPHAAQSPFSSTSVTISSHPTQKGSSEPEDELEDGSIVYNFIWLLRFKSTGLILDCSSCLRLFDWDFEEKKNRLMVIYTFFISLYPTYFRTVPMRWYPLKPQLTHFRMWCRNVSFKFVGAKEEMVQFKFVDHLNIWES